MALECFGDPAIAGVELHPHILTGNCLQRRGKQTTTPATVGHGLVPGTKRGPAKGQGLTAQVLNGNTRTENNPKTTKRSRTKRNGAKQNPAKQNATGRRGGCAPTEWPHEPHTRCGGCVVLYKNEPPRTMTHLQNKIRKQQGAKRRNQATPNCRNPTPAIAGVIASTTRQMNPPPPEMMTNPPNKGHKHDLPRNNRQTKPEMGCTTQGPGPQMNHIPASAAPRITQPRNATCQNPNQTKPRPPAVHQTKPRCKTTGNADGTTHPPKRVPSLHENPPDKHPDEPAVCAATQARNSQPLNTTINNIAYHTPAAAGVW
ncbi:hypothetical protein BS47DRAFT_1369273 [Hydnum rufescens UP504]|uniref:Uncharacterized protein n=1 Tax=Hydnum rufescens UP504 TaxID=1448309 RepID=A0A9P6ADE1_9AGAM|nr:hypothetical protein BS47DRAFT_1369273 [Hydnum rufescens UP504]